MNLEEELKDTDIDSSKSSSMSVVTIFAIILIVALFIGDILFSKNSYSVYQKLKREKTKLKMKIEDLKLKNAQLHKQYFNFISIMPSNEDDEDE